MLVAFSSYSADGLHPLLSICAFVQIPSRFLLFVIAPEVSSCLFGVVGFFPILAIVQR